MSKIKIEDKINLYIGCVGYNMYKIRFGSAWFSEELTLTDILVMLGITTVDLHKCLGKHNVVLTNESNYWEVTNLNSKDDVLGFISMLRDCWTNNGLDMAVELCNIRGGSLIW